MNSIAIRLIVFACVFGGALFGMFLRSVLPEHQLSADSSAQRPQVARAAAPVLSVNGLFVEALSNRARFLSARATARFGGEKRMRNVED